MVERCVYASRYGSSRQWLARLTMPGRSQPASPSNRRGFGPQPGPTSSISTETARITRCRPSLFILSILVIQVFQVEADAHLGDACVLVYIVQVQRQIQFGQE